MKHVVGLALALLITTACVPAFAQGPLADVPTDHWAYEAMNQLAEAGILEGYPDGTFKGNRTLTRYEFAMAIARTLDYAEATLVPEGIKGPAGPAGPAGAAGPAGPAGPAGAAGTGAGMTDAQKQLLDRLEKEFMPELKELSVLLDDAIRRIEELEMQEMEMPPITVSGSLNYRAGWYGNKLEFTHGETTGYPSQRLDIGLVESEYPYDNSPAGNSFAYGVWIADSVKDSHKVNDFATLRTEVTFSGNVNDNVSVLATLLAEPRTNYTFLDYGSLSPNIDYSNGVMDNVRVDEAWVKYDATFIVPTQWTVGKQYVSVGQGLLFDNNQHAMKGAYGMASLGGNLTLSAFGAQLDREAFGSQSTGPVSLPADIPGNLVNDVETWGQDTYAVGRVALPLMGWDVGGNWLQNGFFDERGWSIDASGKLLGFPVSFEYATLLRNAAGVKSDDWEASDSLGVDDNTAYVIGAGLIDNASISLGAKYGEVQPLYALAVQENDGSDPAGGLASFSGGFAPYSWTQGYLNLPMSQLHPYAEFSAHDINWVDRPLFLDATNVARGFEVDLTLKSLLGSDTPLNVRYYDGDAYCEDYLAWLLAGGTSSGMSAPGKWRDADAAVVVSLTREVAEDVNLTLLYGRRQVKNVMRPNPDDESDYLADPIEVIRGELSVAF